MAVAQARKSSQRLRNVSSPCGGPSAGIRFLYGSAARRPRPASDGGQKRSRFSIDKVIRKLVEDVTPCACLKVRPNRGRARDQGNGPVHFPNKSLGRLAAPFQVPLKSLIDFPESFRSKPNPGAAHSASPGTDLGSLPMGSLSRPLPPTQPPEQQLPDATLSRRPPPVQTPGSPTGYPQSRLVHRRASSAPFAVETRLFS